jgi:ATP-dependent exoDNAse (exonuclease V) alpha subunit
LSVGEAVRITKNFGTSVSRFGNNELCTVKAIPFADDRVILGDQSIHLDQGIAVTSHAAQGKTVDQVIVSAPVATFSQVNEAQLYVSMSRARHAMHLFTDSVAALRQAVTKTSKRPSATSVAKGLVETVLVSITRPCRRAKHAFDPDDNHHHKDYARYTGMDAQRGVDMARGIER